MWLLSKQFESPYTATRPFPAAMSPRMAGST